MLYKLFARLIRLGFLAISKMNLPERFRTEIEKTGARLQAARQHLMLLDNEGLYVLERWRVLRHFKWEDWPDDPHRNRKP